MPYKKAPAIHPIAFKRKCKKGIYFPKVKSLWRTTTNKNRKWLNKQNKLKSNNL